MKNKILDVSKVRKQVRNQSLLNDVSFSIYEADICGLVGPNGSKNNTYKGIDSSN